MTKSPLTLNTNSRSILIPTFNTITFIDPYEISYIRAMQNYCMLYRQDGSHVFASTSFGKAFEMLEMYGLYQCHKSYAINMNSILRYHKKGVVELVGQTEVPVARRRKEEFFAEMQERAIAGHPQN